MEVEEYNYDTCEAHVIDNAQSERNWLPICLKKHWVGSDEENIKICQNCKDYKRK